MALSKHTTTFIERLLLQVPVNLLRASRVFVFEPPPGIKANLFRTFSTIPAARMCRVSVKFDALLLISATCT